MIDASDPPPSSAFEPDLCIQMYRQMVLIRHFEELALKLRLEERIHGVVHPYSGQEASATGFETTASCVTPELAYLVEVERFRAKVGSGEEFVTGALMVTSILRPEESGWRIVHRHADPITSARAAESIVQHRS